MSDTEKRILLTILLSMVVIFLHSYILNRFYEPSVKEKTVEVEEKEEKKAQEKRAEQKVPQTLVPYHIPEDVEEKTTTLETPLFRAMFTTIGGGIKNWSLKGYREALDEDSEPVDMIGIRTKESALSTALAEQGKVTVIPFERFESSDGAIRFFWQSPEGIRVEKRYAMGRDYTIDVEIRVSNGSKRRFTGAVEDTLVAHLEKNNYYYHTGPLIRTEKELIRQPADTARETGRDNIRWLGLEDKYFLLSIHPPEKHFFTWSTEVIAENLARAIISIPLELEPGENSIIRYTSYIGPKEYDLLVKYGLEEAIEFGFFSFLAKPFLVILNFFERYLKNYGLAIIVLTCIIKIIFYPLTKHSLNSMKELQKIQPQLNALREKYKNDKERMQKELMELYKRYKINPLGGCLPILLQIPVFIALYEVLSVAIELRHAPFVLWIRDLSAKDPYYVTPLLMGASMFIQQKLTPTTVDPAQEKIMLLMPVVFTILFMSFPSGLVLYWLVNNILSIIQQYHIHKSSKR